MKYLLTLMFSAIVLIGCSGKTPEITQGIPSEDVEQTTAEETASDTDGAATDEPAKEGDDEDKTDEKKDTEGVDQKNVKLVVEDQETAGQIIVKEVATSRDGWVSVHRSQEGGGIVLPNSIGEARVDSGNSEEIVVDLWESPYIGEKLWVLLHIDAGERGKYEFPEKDVAVRKNGETMARSFKVKGGPEDEEKKEDEEKEEE